MEALPLMFPVPVLTSRSALAPKLIRRANGEVGDPLNMASPSSTALSSIDVVGDVPLEILPCRALTLVNADAWVGDPESPREVTDMRRRCCA